MAKDEIDDEDEFFTDEISLKRPGRSYKLFKNSVLNMLKDYIDDDLEEAYLNVINKYNEFTVKNSGSFPILSNF